jgi:hypothetical protein
MSNKIIIRGEGTEKERRGVDQRKVERLENCYGLDFKVESTKPLLK